MYRYQNLQHIPAEVLHTAFVRAFSDYQVNFDLPPDAFRTMLVRRGFDAALSFGAFTEDNHELVGFVLNGSRQWNGKPTVYDLGTGVVPEHRRQGITSEILHLVLDTLRQKNISQYLLEVLQNNTGAFRLYKQQGFRVTREFTVFGLNRPWEIISKVTYNIVYTAGITPDEWPLLMTFWDFEPSWQNSVDSVRAIQKDLLFARVYIDNKIAGYGIMDKHTGDIPQIAVHKDHRQKGIARSILADFQRYPDASGLRIVNVDTTCRSLHMCLARSGFEQTASQYEMILLL